MNEPAVTLLKRLREHSAPLAGQRILVAVSGGADSMALLHLYTRVRDDLRLTLTAATFDHGLRRDAGRADAAHVQERAAAWDVPCIAGRAIPERDLKSVETWARQARYAFLARLARDVGAQYVATAHHADDQTETVLANIIRGAGGHGLGGMRARAPLPGAPDLTLVRPLLSFTHDDLVTYCRSEGIEWREDATNTDTRHRRNWIRHAVIPLLREANPNVSDAVSRLAAAAAEQDDYMTGVVDGLLSEHATITTSRVWIARERFLAWHPALQKRALIQTSTLVDSGFEPDSERIQAATAMSAAPEGGIVELGAGMVVTVDSGWISIAHARAPWTPPYDGYWIGVSGDSEVLPQLTPVELDTPELAVLTVNVPTAADVRVRRRSDGDRVYPLSLHGKSQKLKDWLINRKVPRQLRDHLPVVEAAGQVVGIWDGKRWDVFAPPFEAETIEIGLTWRLSST